MENYEILTNRPLRILKDKNKVNEFTKELIEYNTIVEKISNKAISTTLNFIGLDTFGISVVQTIASVKNSLINMSNTQHVNYLFHFIRNNPYKIDVALAILLIYSGSNYFVQASNKGVGNSAYSFVKGAAKGLINWDSTELFLSISEDSAKNEILLIHRVNQIIWAFMLNTYYLSNTINIEKRKVVQYLNKYTLEIPKYSDKYEAFVIEPLNSLLDFEFDGDLEIIGHKKMKELYETPKLIVDFCNYYKLNGPNEFSITLIENWSKHLVNGNLIPDDE